MTRKGEHPSPETIGKMRIAQKGKKRTPETIEKMRAFRRANWQQPEYREKKSAQSRANWTKPEFRERMAEVRQAQPPHSAETRARIGESRRGIPLSDERRKVLSLAAQRLWESEEYRAKVTARVRDPEVKARVDTPRSRELKSASRRAYWAQFTPEERRAKLAAFNRAGTTASLTQRANTSIERMVQAVLDRHGVEYRAQHQLGVFFIDFLIPKQRICLECDGDYWHSRPQQIEADARRDRWLRMENYRVVRLSETSINADAERAVCEALNLPTP